jgi:hypothetical protein
MAVNERQVFPVQLSGSEQLLERPVDRVTLCDHQQSRGVSIETVDNACPPRFVPTRGDAGQRLSERPRAVTPPGMNNHSGRLIYHQQMLVFIRQSEPRGLALGGDGRRLLLPDSDSLTAPQYVALRAQPPIDGNRARIDQPLGLGARAQWAG